MNATYQQEVIQRQQEIIRAYQNELDWEKRLFSNASLKPSDKLILWKTTPPEVKRGQQVEQPEEKKLYITQDAKEIGMSPDTYGSRLQRIAETTQALAHRREREPAQDGTPVWRVYVAPTPALAAPEKIELPPAGAGHGGRRVKKCLSCGSSNLVETRQVVCADCGVPQSDKTIHLVNSPDEEAIPQDDDSHNEEQNASPQDDGWQQEELEDPKIFCEPAGNLTEYYDPVTPPIVAEIFPAAVEVEQSTKFVDLPAGKMTPGAYPLNGFSLEDLLSRRIGHGQIIVSTGKLDQAAKYISKPADYTPNIAAYLRGDLAHIYGSRPAFPDGTTHLLGFDCDTPELDGGHLAWMELLAAAGIPSVYWKRRPGRGHLEVYVDHPVDRKAFYAHLISVCPGLMAIPEVFPIGSDQNTGGVDRADFGYSWPLYYRSGNHVHECAAEVMFSGDQVPMLSTGIESNRERLTWLISQALTPAACIPERIVTQASAEATKPGGALLEKPRASCTAISFDTDVAKLAIRSWNDAHTWEEIADVRNGRFLASWRGEHTPSVVIDPDGCHACDYGKHGNFPKKVDRFEAWCLINGLDRRAEKERLCIAYRERQEVLV